MAGLAIKRLGQQIDRLYARGRARWIDLFSLGYLAVSAFLCALADVTFALYVPMSLGQFALLFVFCEVVILAALGWGTLAFQREAEPIRRWLRRPARPDGAAEAWLTAVRLPRRALGIAMWRAVVLAGVPATLMAATEFSFSVTTVLLFFIGLLGAAIYPTLLFYFALELYLRPLLADIGRTLPPGFEPPAAGVSVRRKVIVALPLMNVISGGFVGCLATLATGGSLTDLGLSVLFSFVIAATFSLVLTLLIARALLNPVDDLLTATQRITEGDLSTRAPIVSGDEMGQLASSFNTMTSELVQSRRRLLEAREEERRRLRRDLHDGLGPTLAAVILQLDTARRLVGQDPPAADALLQQLRSETQQAVDDIRRLVYALRPPALDDLGLVRAIRENAATFASDGGLKLHVDAPPELPPLPASVEVAAFRIFQEALTNVARHSGAHECHVRLSCNGRFELEVADDGCGIPAARIAGVGLQSMRERAAEVGGRFEVNSQIGAGTRVRAWLPSA